MKQKKIPVRMCVSCHESKPKKELIRVVRLPDKVIAESNDGREICIDLTGKMAGRGAYICNNAECFKNAKKSKRLDKALETTIDDSIYDELIRQMEGINDR